MKKLFILANIVFFLIVSCGITSYFCIVLSYNNPELSKKIVQLFNKQTKKSYRCYDRI